MYTCIRRRRIYFRVYIHKRFQCTKVVVGDEIFIYRRITYVIILNRRCAHHTIELLYLMEFVWAAIFHINRIWVRAIIYDKTEKFFSFFFSLYVFSSRPPFVVSLRTLHRGCTRVRGDELAWQNGHARVRNIEYKGM